MPNIYSPILPLRSITATSEIYLSSNLPGVVLGMSMWYNYYQLDMRREILEAFRNIILLPRQWGKKTGISL